MWAKSSLNVTVHLDFQPTEGASMASTADVPLPPGVPTLLRTFSDNDTLGVWVLVIVEESNVPPVNFELSPRGTGGSLLTGTYTVAGTILAQNFVVPGGLDFYDGQACLLGGGASPTPTVQVPPGAGGGEVQMQRYGGDLVASGLGLGNQTFAYWVEMYYSYSFLAANSSGTLVSRDAVSTSTGLGELSRTEPSSTVPLQDEGTQRPGVYTMEAFFMGSAGTVGESQAQVLVQGDGTWISLAGCAQTQVQQDGFVLTSLLGSDPTAWPTYAYFTYRSQGVEGYLSAPLRLNLSSLTFVGEPWGSPLGGYSISTDVSGGKNVTSAGGGTVFADVGGGASVAYSVSLGGKEYYSGILSSVSPGSSITVRLNVSRALVDYFVGGSPFPGGNVTVLQGGEALVHGTTDAAGQAVFLLPPGTYQVQASGGNSSASASMTLSIGQSQEVQLGAEGGGEGGGGLTVYLLAVGLAALGLNLVVYVRGRLRRARVRRLQGGPGLKPSHQ